MKKLQIFIAAIALSCTSYSFAQAPVEDEAQDSRAKHYFNLGIKAGYAAMMDMHSPLDAHLLGGPGGGLGLTYELQKGHFLFDIGLEADYLHSLSRYDFQATRHLLQPYDMTYNYRFVGWNESRNGMYVGLPIMVGAEFNRVYFLVGGKVAYGLMGNYSNYGQYDVTAYDPALAGPIGGTEHGLGLHTVNKGAAGFTGNKLALSAPEVRVMAEVGMNFQPNIGNKKGRASRPKPGKKGQKPSKYLPFNPKNDLSFRVALFAEYGVLDQNSNPASNALAYAYAQEVEPTGGNTVLGQQIDGKAAAMNNLFAGVKFTVRFNVFNPRPVKPVIPPSYFTLKIADENGEPTLAKVEIRNEGKQKTTVPAKDVKKGVMRRKYPLGEYTAVIAKPDYYTDTIHFNIVENGSNDSLLVTLRPLPKIEEIVEVPVEEVVGQVFVLHNMFFATNQTTILPESEAALQVLYDFLTANPNTRIKIIGHTDSVGKDAANQTLSEGRAEAVRQALIARGIDAARMESEGRGESEPIADNETEEGRAQNRRVEVEVLE